MQQSQHAVVIGGSIAGLFAARILSDHFERVTILERDHLPETSEFRNGVSQANHIHALLPRGYRFLQKVFPGIENDLDELGAQMMDFGKDAVVLGRDGWSMRFETDLHTRACSRVLLEWVVRKRLLQDTSVSINDGCRVTQLLTTADKKRVTGVTYSESGHSEAHSLDAGLVIDASGRGSHAAEWLHELGYGRTEESIINAFLGYASRRYRLAPDFQPDWKMLLIFARPPDGLRGGAMLHEEGDIWVTTLAGACHDYPPTDADGFLDFAQTLPTSLLYEAIQDAEPVTDIRGYRQTANHLRHYERFKRWPEGFVVVGDAVCAFNPVYGQGMSVSAMGAELLDEILRKHRKRNSHGGLHGMAVQFQRELAKVNQPAWVMATGEDLRFPETQGGSENSDSPVSLIDRLTQLYMDQLAIVMKKDYEIWLTFGEVFTLLKPPTALFQPKIIWRVLLHLLRGGTTNMARFTEKMPPPVSRKLSPPDREISPTSENNPR